MYAEQEYHSGPGVHTLMKLLEIHCPMVSLDRSWQVRGVLRCNVGAMNVRRRFVRMELTRSCFMQEGRSEKERCVSRAVKWEEESIVSRT